MHSFLQSFARLLRHISVHSCFCLCDYLYICSSLIATVWIDTMKHPPAVVSRQPLRVAREKRIILILLLTLIIVDA